MAGHSQFKNIMYRKGAQDAKRAKVFTKITREISVAVKEGGPDSDSNPRLRAALLAARGVNMPKDNIDRAIKKAQGGDDDTQYDEMRYEGYGPGGVAIIVEALTDNRNRTAADIRSAFNKYKGSLAEAHSVSFQFNHLGLIVYNAEAAHPDKIFEAVVEAGGDDVESTSDDHMIRCAIPKLHAVRESLILKFGEPQSAKIIWEPQNTVMVTPDNVPILFKLMDVLEDNDDVQDIFANYILDEHQLKTIVK